MSTIIQEMLKQHDITTIYNKKNALKEVIQEIILCGLSRAGFFKEAAFYGGTALRIFYGLDRFSEDLDFSLLKENQNFNLSKYFPILEKEVKSFGLNVEITEKEKTADSDIKSAFLKGNTREHMLLFYPNSPLLGITSNELIKIKFEVDINPPKYANFDPQFKLLPAPYEVNLYDAPSLFAGKLHAVICRSWKNRIKGRDLYDYVFYLSKGTQFNLPHLKERLVQTEAIAPEKNLTIDDVKNMLIEKFDAIDYDQAKKDVIPFIKDTKSIDIWSANFFKAITQGLRCE
ncbi:MAG: nucleotidyl transferase AbiEii/AbiGii toxin family protein [Phascolarctobacterium sp.]|nr:nucleotidyl transferase AbiEii/AbiGii toxin family protein [Phascolarctobacterium sp.]